jgi:hypothetical protein
MNKRYIFIWVGILCPCIMALGQDITNLKNEKPFAVNGDLDIRSIVYSAKGIDARRSPLSYIISGSPTFSLYGFTIPVSFTFSEQDRSFNQPFNQFGLSPTYKWITLHAGYRNISFSPYTLAGHTMLGGGVELKPGKFTFGIMTGRLNRATSVDTVSGYIRPESFSRYGTAARAGYGSGNKQINISFISASDSRQGFKGNPDSAALNQEANLVLGSDFKYTFLKKFYVYGDGAVSIYTKNIHSDLEIDIDSTRKGLKTLEKLIDLNATSEYYLAYSGGIAYTEKNFSIKAGYKLVEPNFRSMGAYFFQNDLRNITLSPSFNALKGKLRFIGSLGIQEDNRDKKKTTSTKRIISMANLSWDATDQFGFDANYTNFTASSEPTVTMVENKYLLAQTNQNLSLTPRMIIPGTATTQVIILSYNASSLKDLNQDTSEENDIFSSVAFLNYNLTLNQTGLNLTAGINYVNNKIAIGNISNKGLTMGASKGFMKNKLMVSTNNSYMQSGMTDGKGNIINLGLNASYSPIKSHRIGLRNNYLSNNTKRENTGSRKYSEFTGEVGYTYSF